MKEVKTNIQSQKVLNINSKDKMVSYQMDIDDEEILNIKKQMDFTLTKTQIDPNYNS